MKTKVIKALWRQTGSYGTVNAGDTVTLPEDTANELIALGNFEETTTKNETATPEEMEARKESGIQQDPIHADGTNREILNTEGRVLHESGPEAVDEAQARADADVAPEVILPNVPTGDEPKGKAKKG